MRKIILPLALAQIADLVSTALVLSKGGYETNPVANFLLHNGGWPALAMSKVIVVLIAVLIMENAFQYKDRYLTIARIIINTITVAIFIVAAWNTFVALTL